MASEKQIGVQFYCDEEEYAAIKSAADKDMRSIASFAKFNTLKAANALNAEQKEA